jgi:hypothetical protein
VKTGSMVASKPKMAESIQNATIGVDSDRALGRLLDQRLRGHHDSVHTKSPPQRGSWLVSADIAWGGCAK